MNRVSRHRRILGYAFSAMMALSCSSAHAEPTSRTKGDSSTMRPRYFPRPGVIAGPTAGGSGGSVIPESCKRVYGINIDGGTTIRRFGLKCADEFGVAVGDLPILGGSSGFSFPLECQDGYIVSGFYGRSGSLLDGIGLICRPVNAALDLQDMSTMVGGGGGGGFSWECPRSFHLATVNIGSGTSIDSIQPICEHD